MILLDDLDPGGLEAKVDARIRALRSAPNALMQRFDADGDGSIDTQEWAALRRIVTEEVLAEIAQTAGPRVERAPVGNYDLLGELGHGAQGHTHLARHRTTGELAAIKLLNVSDTADWKHFDLLKREAKVLNELDHKGIPDLLESFETDIDGKLGIALVQQYISGDNLAYRLAAGELFDEPKLVRIAEDVLVLLTYLHRRNPPIVHRDVKPANIIVNDQGVVFLVDFGAVQFEGKGADTIVGTTGYMPPEQLMSRPVTASDLYSLGATLVHLATRRHPAELETTRMKLQWHDGLNLTDPFFEFIDRLIEPVLEDRFSKVEDAIAGLDLAKRGLMTSKASQAIAVQEPARGDVTPIVWAEKGVKIQTTWNCTVYRSENRITLFRHHGMIVASVLLLCLGLVFFIQLSMLVSIILGGFFGTGAYYLHKILFVPGSTIELVADQSRLIVLQDDQIVRSFGYESQPKAALRLKAKEPPQAYEVVIHGSGEAYVLDDSAIGPNNRLVNVINEFLLHHVEDWKNRRSR